ncbi:MAG: 5-methyltetrahydropteroyltriglutamate--homocysteine S-methyltransferase [Pseudodesulfovibrio sp.]|uniref:5-methyltetrahydropteroyltriglutamate--homocysteine methyltransferase n=1 Tax=Pseudodesulfovibrio aespoeensis (strain ATCC 700646 / DSM 10631 / Aspo-2) TaxID=643562 RepID=E6VW63_PSEA9|nr:MULTISPECIES: 5-methyltetrahydropteroyltriglutamate--homocysteine S-methyltransferase [Pseudodesulfovibrio]MBU4191545.1 5-methyltetrahydropteroyltriglutamate--homocysteine S-methyltransferase [Pseudomonadota bacterium]ADU63623.1 5-methyltetrahydropteroyltriglutamate/homocysteine S-methyltransferase [Pseudodesulfovibrio aespoeensis Aspo-2]MBU4243238.1 5-methyltetrahydropteroyltriglutamate--homocysteine S-methyltransferase [Pseudomonadota bacterium]MBU4379952.1 5-methyltetrahydropteroyltriglut
MNAHVLGFPRMGTGRELKWALEDFWQGRLDESGLLSVAWELKERHWAIQAQAGLDSVCVGDHSLYDHVLDTAIMVGAVPERFLGHGGGSGLDTYFRMARGDADANVPAMTMTKWFDSNYHYIVPEIGPDTTFTGTSGQLARDIHRAVGLGYNPRPILVGPLTFLLLAREVGGVSRWDHMEALTRAYCDILGELAGQARWVQLDEPALCLDLPPQAAEAARHAYAQLAKACGPSQILLATYFGELRENLGLAVSLPVDALHLDLVRGRAQLQETLAVMPQSMHLSLGLVNGRNIWRTDLDASARLVDIACAALGEDRVMVASSCSLLHAPMDVESENALDPSLKQWMAFAVQKCAEVAALKGHGSAAAPALFAENRAVLAARNGSALVHNPAVAQRLLAIDESMLTRTSPAVARATAQQARMGLPLFPTTTIGSYPQTAEIRQARLAHKRGELSDASYQEAMRRQIKETVGRQERLDLDVLVHGEPERNDMVEYFGQQLDGFCFTSNGWVQSYGSRCVKPPVIFGDVSRPGPMTVDWAVYAQSLTDRPMKGMLTGPVTILCWSFVRDDIPRSEVCRQIALAVRDEVRDLEAAGISIIQIDEAALREGMPLRESERGQYLRWAVDCFRLASSGVDDATQIHSHMCYSEFNTIVEWIARMDADVVSIEASRSGMRLLDAFDASRFPARIGPGIYDIHSPRIPDAEEILQLLRKALRVVPADRLWVNPDCGLKTRAWPETLASLRNMVTAAKQLRAEHLEGTRAE